MNKKTILQVKNLSISFIQDGKLVPAVKDVSFSLRKGETLAIVGESGSGKSVTAKALVGLNPPETSVINSGSVIYNNEDLLLLSKEKLRLYRGKEIAMIFQDPISYLNPTMTVGKQIQENYLQHHKHASRQEAKEAALEYLHLVGLPNPSKQFKAYPHELSGGMRQRVMIAITLVAEPKILIADEPTTALDMTIQAQILDLLKKVQEKLGMSIIFITHDLNIVAGFCSHIKVMYAGSIIESASTLNLFKTPKHPYTQKLLQSIPRLDLKRTDRLIPIEGAPPSCLEMIPGCSFCPRCPHAMKICNEIAPDLKLIDEDTGVACWLYEIPSPVNSLKAVEVYDETPH